MKTKTMPLTVRRCPPEVHQALKKSAKANRRSLNNETLIWLEKQASDKPVTARETAEILRQFQAAISAQDRKEMAAAIEEVRKRMANDHLHGLRC